MESREKVRFLTTANTIILQKLILKEVHQLKVENSNSPSLMLIKSPIPCQNSLKKIMAEIEYIRVELPWFQRFKINLWLKAAIDSSSRANQFELGSDPDSVS
jgi:hypothetical protein